MHIIIIFSGPPSCLCSTPEECEITGDNELDFVPFVAEVTMKIFQIFHFDIYYARSISVRRCVLRMPSVDTTIGKISTNQLELLQ